MGVMPRQGLARLANALGFQGVWFATVAGAGSGRPWLGPLAALLFAVLTLAASSERRSDLVLVALAIPFGFAMDSVWVRLGLMEFASPWPSTDWAPAWILALWVGFALTVNHSLSYVCERPALAAVLGAVAGPLAYVAAERAFGAVALTAPTAVVVGILGAAWALTVPLLGLAAQRVARRAGPVQAGLPS